MYDNFPTIHDWHDLSKPLYAILFSYLFCLFVYIQSLVFDYNTKVLPGGWSGNMNKQEKHMKIRYQRFNLKFEGEMPVTFLKKALKLAGSLKPSR